jgi:riboflavin synthase
MFTGLIEEVGKVRQVSQRKGGWRIVVEAGALARRLKLGDSIAVSGVCLTALDISRDSFAADLAEETVSRTSLSRLAKGDLVNLELPMKAGSPLGGHIVQGHVDGVATLVSMQRVKNGSDWRLTLELPVGLERYVVAKGSITVEGISLTVAAIRGRKVEIAVIPHTYSATNVKNLAKNALLNIEVDVLAKYAEKQDRSTASVITKELLLREGF